MAKRIVSFLSLFIVFTILLTACGETAATPTTTTAPATATTGSTGAATAPATDTTAAGGAATAAATGTTAGALVTATTGTNTGTTGQPATTAVLQRTDIGQSFVRNFNPFASRPLVPTLAGIYEPLMIYNMAKGELVPWL